MLSPDERGRPFDLCGEGCEEPENAGPELRRLSVELEVARARLNEEIQRRKRFESRLRELEDQLELRKHREKNLRMLNEEVCQSRERLRFAMESSHSILWEWDIEDDSVNFITGPRPLFEEILGKEKVGLEAWKKRIHPDDRAEVMQDMADHLNGETPYFWAEYRLRMASGGWKWVQVRGKVVERSRIGEPRHMMGIMYDVTERKEIEDLLSGLHEKLFRSATTDMLTGSLNRQHFDDILNKEIGRARRYGQTFSLIMLDIDDFKRINDTFGHLAGDGVLKVISELVQNNIRSSDYFARWGGEEFMILTPQGLDEAVKLAEKNRRMIEELIFPDIPMVTASFGVAEYRPDDVLESITRRVDEAMYRAKEKGKNRVEIWRNSSMEGHCERKKDGKTDF